ncbi:CBS domain-containing protein [Shewanella loihica]|uniref:Putative signal transduction protein with CBS domains n=1 Tax=Shewanella loihica (strain ATCC BAA-1088 / PV-4) TaxID=323850 RepID=A3QDT4_SHELP|nr:MULTISPECIES: CBS domain-containing protein [Shewanella]ABO23632.1 putative signal transduction protein with CBS domains [Shewanella loihica PV-4]MCG9722848.1 CBS domain-containing protein [Shewanella sp. Isolate7]MCG9746285.1 CBS domain-containing protein [Shewanella sp. Isolate8]MCL2911950.1 CBS domain-containing protein [Shewanella aquimarina]QYJ84096.1 CBS domain-containing protein [Shewanella aegiceratis]
MESMKVVDYMDRQPVLLQADMTLAAAVEKLLSQKKLGAAVVDAQGHLVGFLSQQDCLAVMLKSTYHCDLTANVSDCMRTDVLTVSKDEPIISLAEQMLLPKPKIYPVIDQGRVVGIIDRNAVLRAINTSMQECYLKPA